MTVLEQHRKTWVGKSDEWLFERLDNELKQKVEEIHKLLQEKANMYSEEEVRLAMVEFGCFIFNIIKQRRTILDFELENKAEEIIQSLKQK